MLCSRVDLQFETSAGGERGQQASQVAKTTGRVESLGNTVAIETRPSPCEIGFISDRYSQMLHRESRQVARQPQYGREGIPLRKSCLSPREYVAHIVKRLPL